MTSKIQLKLVRSFSGGFSVHSPALNGFYIEVYLGCFHLSLWNRAKGKMFGFSNYWSG